MPDIIEWPTSWVGVVGAKFGLMPKSIRSQSPWTMKQNVYGPHVQYWSASLQFPVMEDTELASREALIESLGGTSGLLRIGHPFRLTPMFNGDVAAGSQAWSDGTFFDDGSGWLSGLLPSTIYVVSTAYILETSVVVGGLPVSTNRVLRRGDLVEFRRDGIATEIPSLHRVKNDASSDASGFTRINIAPPLRKGLAPGDQVVLDNPMTVFRVSGEDVGMAQRDLTWTGNFSLDLVEALV